MPTPRESKRAIRLTEVEIDLTHRSLSYLCARMAARANSHEPETDDVFSAGVARDALRSLAAKFEPKARA
ncbi:MAG TPA: hypothetical protein VEA35_00565 [Ramlibacter sp.]|nr:hypothetical protein [Ramlibacter sp.]